VIFDDDGPIGEEEEPGGHGCPQCFGIRFVYVTLDGEDLVRPCDCRPEIVRRNIDPLDASGIRSNWQASFTLSRFTPRSSEQSDAFAQALDFYQSFPHTGEDSGKGLVFWGGPGVGKTHLAVGLLMELIATKGVNGLYWEFGGLLKEIRKSYDPDSRWSDIKPLEAAFTADVLLLDNLASQKLKPWVNDTIFEIINTRYMECRPTLITTRYQMGDSEAARSAPLNQSWEFLVELIGQRTYSRLLEMCEFVSLETEAERTARLKQRPLPTHRLLRERDQNRHS
jgi:DNA replication protein DnaC